MRIRVSLIRAGFAVTGASLAMMMAGCTFSAQPFKPPQPEQPVLSSHEIVAPPAPATRPVEPPPPQPEVAVVPHPATQVAILTPAPAHQPDLPAPPPDPHKDLAFLAVQQAKAQSGDKPQLVVLACANYYGLHPESPITPEVQTIEDEALDALYWSKVDVLCHRRDEQQRALADNKTRIAAQTRDDETPPALLDEKAALTKKLADTEEQLRSLQYLAVQPPPLSHPAQMSRLRAARDPQVYDWWKRLERQKIHDSRGAMW